MKFTIDLLFGWAHPGTKMVRQAPQGMRGWFIHGMTRKILASDGYVYVAAVRLIGFTVGVTVTRECVTPLTALQAVSPSGAPAPAQVSPSTAP